MPQSLHVLSAHIIFSTKGRQPWLTSKIRKRVSYQSRILQNLECDEITVGGAANHIHILCNLTKKFPTAKVVEVVKKDSSKFIKTLGAPTFRWQDGYGLFGVSRSHFEAVRKYILDQEKHHKYGNVSGGVSPYSEKVRRPLRRTVFVGLSLECLFKASFGCDQVPEGDALG